MKIIIIILASILGIYPSITSIDDKEFNFVLKNEKWEFPVNVGKVVSDHKLDFKPPGHYYKNFEDGSEVILYYHYHDGDFDNEYQSKEKLFNRDVHSYIFRFENKHGVYDSLRNDLENKYNKKFVLTKGEIDDRFKKYASNESEMQFQWDFLKINDHTTIGIVKGNKKVTVRYMYDLPLGIMGVYMKSFIE